jgi:hypothetical protein
LHITGGGPSGTRAQSVQSVDDSGYSVSLSYLCQAAPTASLPAAQPGGRSAIPRMHRAGFKSRTHCRSLCAHPVVVQINNSQTVGHGWMVARSERKPLVASPHEDPTGRLPPRPVIYGPCP